jgi:hypothetical protein
MVNLTKGVTLAKHAPADNFEFHVIRPDGTGAVCSDLRAELSRNDLQTYSSLLTFARITGYHYFAL